MFFPFLGSLVAYLGGTKDKKLGIYAALAFSAVTLAAASAAFHEVYTAALGPGQYALTETHPWVSLPGFSMDFLLGVDGLSAPLMFVSAVLVFLAVAGAKDFIDRKEPVFYALVLFVEGSVMGAFASLNLVAFYVFWELALIPMFLLIGVWGGDRRKYAAMKFIVFTFAGSAVMLLGFLALYLGVSPSTFDIPDLAGKVPAALQYLPLLAVFVGFAVELPVFPFHSWQPDAYEQAPPSVNVLLSGILPNFAGYGVIRVAISLFPQAAYQYAWAFIALAVVSMFYGAVVAVLTRDLKRLLAYTSINHMGFVLLGAFATVVSGNPLGIEGAIFMMFAHSLGVGALFTIAGLVEKRYGSRDVNLLAGLRQRMPVAAVLFALSLTASMGLPPFASFLAEVLVISGGISAYPIVAVTILVPVITGGYLIWLVRRTVVTPPAAGEPAGTVATVAAAGDLSTAQATEVALYLVPLIVLIVFSFLVLAPAAGVALWTVQLGGQP